MIEPNTPETVGGIPGVLVTYQPVRRSPDGGFFHFDAETGQPYPFAASRPEARKACEDARIPPVFARIRADTGDILDILVYL